MEDRLQKGEVGDTVFTFSNTSLNLSGFELDVSLQIGFYVLIFLLAILGNGLVLVTLAQNKGMRTILNLFLLNLAMADLLVGVLCMPFSLTGTILKDFIFGPALCKLIPYSQALSVSVSAWTLVAISVQRYYAICHPLTSRRWQTVSQAYRMIGLIWILSGICMIPISIMNTLQPVGDTGRQKCREDWMNRNMERAYTISLDVLLLIFPLVIMSVNYYRIKRTLWQTQPRISLMRQRSTVIGKRPSGIRSKLKSFKSRERIGMEEFGEVSLSPELIAKNPSFNTKHKGDIVPRRSNIEKSLKQKKRVIQMLSVVVLEFFICWTPLYVMNTWYHFDPDQLYNLIGPVGVSLIQLLAYVSSCVNPITYCFMNSGFRSAFVSVFGSWGSEG